MKTTSITMRTTVVPEDCDRVRDIVMSTGVFAEYEVEIAVELVQERLAKGEKSGYYFVFADQDGQTVGYSCFGPIACTLNRFDLFWIAVDRKLHNYGIGAEILAESEQHIGRMSGQRIYVETSSREDYGPTRAFYLRQGYQITAVVPDFYRDGDDKVIFMKQL